MPNSLAVHRRFPQVFPSPQTPPALTHHLHLTRYGSLHESVPMLVGN